MTSTDVCLYNLTLHRQQNTLGSVLGHFAGLKTQQIVSATAASLTVYQPSHKTGKVTELFSVPLFSLVRSIDRFRIADQGKDYLLVTSDAGNLSILELDLEHKRFLTLFNEPYSKSGIRRLSPGADIAVDPKGRAVLISAIERNKLVYVLNRDSDNKVTVGSPLEANRSKILTLTTIALDVDYANPQFASLEMDYGEYEFENEDATEYAKSLTYYELDLGLNHVLKRHSELVDSSANLLIRVPAGDVGPGGVMVCSRGKVSYMNLLGDKLSVNIPRLEDDKDEVYVVAGTPHTMKDRFFFLLQTNQGDVFKLELPPDKTLVISYFDTLPLCHSLIILKTGFLYADTEYGDKHFYQFEKLGRDVTHVSDSDEPKETATFTRTELENLELTDIVETINPVLDSAFTTDESSTKLYTLSGVKETASLKLLQYGLPITELTESELPGMPSRIFTTKLERSDEYDKYLVISFIDTTLILSIGENAEEVSDSALVTSEETLGIQQIGRHSLAQIHPHGIRVVRDKTAISDWQPPAGIRIRVCSSTQRQIVVGLSNDELVYFEVDDEDRLVEWQERKEMPSTITSLSLGEIPEGLIRSPFLVVGDQDKIIRVFSTDPSSVLELIVMQSLSGVPTSLLMCFMHGELSINIGLDNGVFARTLLNSGGELYQTRTKYLGNKPVQLSKVVKDGENVVLALSTKTWAISQFSTLRINPVLLPPLRFASEFQSEDFKDAIVGIYKNTLTIFSIDHFDKDISSNSLPLKDTPKNIIQRDSKLFITENGHLEKFDTETNEMDAHVELEGKPLCSAIVHFASKEQSYFLVSVSKGAECWIHCYSLEMEFVHKTQMKSTVYTMRGFQGKLLVAMGNQLRLYDMGKKQLLSKATSLVDSLSTIIKMDAMGHRVAVGDIRESVTFLTYNEKMEEFIPFVDDTVTRHVTAVKMVDYDTVVGGDKFGNLFMLRCSEEVSKTGEDSSLVLTRDKLFNGAPFKFDNPCNFYNEDIVTSFHKGAFNQGGRDVVVYTGLEGTVGVLIPLLTRSDIKFFQSLEKAMRQHVQSLTGRMHLLYRGYYQPVKNVVDGDFIETFNDLEDEVKEKIAEDVDKEVAEIEAKIYDVRALSI